MAAIPTVIYCGDTQLIGGAPNRRAPANLALGGVFGGYYGLWQHNWKFSRVVPSGPDGVTGGTFNPYWDGSAITGGAWVKFHYAPSPSPYSPNMAQVLSNGDNWMEGVSADPSGAITATPMLINKLWERWPGGFKLIKATNGYGFTGVNGYKNTGGSMTALVAIVTAAAAALTGGDTLDIKAIICDGIMNDLATVATSIATINADVESFIDNVRGNLDAIAAVTCSSTTPIVLVNPHPEASPDAAVTRGVTVTYRNIQLGAQAANEHVHVFDMGWAETWQTNLVVVPGVTNQPGIYPAAGDRRFYGTDEYVHAGLRLGNFLNAVWAEEPTAPPGSAIPVVMMIGDSNFVGVISNAFIDLSAQASLLGDSGTSTVRAGQYVWDNVDQQLELYDVLANANTFGTVNTITFGPECTLLKKLGDRYPNGVVVFKYARNGVSLVTENGASLAVEEAGDIWPDLLTRWQLFKAQCLAQLGRSPDLVGIVTDVGYNDVATTASSNAFATKVGPWIDALRLNFSTRAEGQPLPIVFLQPPPPVIDGGNSIHNASPSSTMSQRFGTVRSTIAGLPASKQRVGVVVNTGTADYELVRSTPGYNEPVHYGGEALLQIGYDLADALFTLIDSEDGETTTAEAGPSGAAAFTVETGSGSASANSYSSVAAATTYHEAYGNPQAWTAAGLYAQQDALRQATRALDVRYGSWWSGVRVGSTQALDWPRAYVYDAAGNAVPTTTIPTRLQQATAILALLHIQGEDILPDTQTGADIKSETLSSASGASKSVTYIGGKRADTQFPIIDRMLATSGLTSGGGGWGWLDL